MAAVIDFNLCQSGNCKKLKFTEQTGAYDASNNTDGWGSPNEATGDATAATITITDSAGTDYVLNVLADGFPTTDKTKEYTIESDDLGGSASAQLSDGIYTITYTVTTATTTYTQIKKVGLYCQTKCCVFDKFKSIDPDDTCLDDIDDHLFMWGLYQSLVYNAACGNDSRFTTLLTAVNKLCEDCDTVNSGCSSC